MIKVRVRIEGIREILRALDELPEDAQNEVRDGSLKLAETLAGQIRSAGSALGRQDALAARSVVARRDRVPVIAAGSRGGRKAKGVLFGSEFGMTRKSGWYRKRRYFTSRGRQFRPHLGRGSYWFFATVEREQAEVSRAYIAMVDAVARKWGRG